jgi:hypothetical protein
MDVVVPPTTNTDQRCDGEAAAQCFGKRTLELRWRARSRTYLSTPMSDSGVHLRSRPSKRTLSSDAAGTPEMEKRTRCRAYVPEEVKVVLQGVEVLSRVQAYSCSGITERSIRTGGQGEGAEGWPDSQCAQDGARPCARSTACAALTPK